MKPEYNNRWVTDNPLKHAAHVILATAVKRGKIAKQPCEVCGSTRRIHGHHNDYTQPLKVRWLCDKHHKELHRALATPRKKPARLSPPTGKRYELRTRALQLRANGLSYAAIGKRLGMSESQAFKTIKATPYK